MSHSILRRYTPPTCTLEIRAKNSPLSRWAGQPVLKQLRFQLTLDDPTLAEEKWIKIQGDRAQLEALQEVVASYVQAFLEQSHSRLSGTAFASLSETENSIAVLSSLAPMSALATTASSTPGIEGLTLKPRGLLTHDLTLGALAPHETRAIVSLSALQLFDLANALDDYASDVVALPEVQRSRGLASAPVNWGQIAATGLIVIGLSASVAKIIDSSMKPASPTASQEASSSDQQIAANLPPTSEVQPSIAPKQTLPPPPPLGSTVPMSPGLPTIAVPSPSTAGANVTKPSAGSITVNPVAPPTNARIAPSGKGGGSVAIVPQTGLNRAAKLPVQAPAPTQPLALNREFANAAPPSQSSGAASRAAASEGKLSADQAGTAFDTLPQVAEARQYFQQRWHSPEGLTQTLEYTLLVGANGSIQRTIPLGQAAGDYIDRTGIPLVGEPFVSPIRGERNAKIRLVLSPDGTVKTFLEGFY